MTQVKSVVRSLEDLRDSFSGKVDVPVGTIGVIEEIGEGGPEGKWLHVLWDVGKPRGKTYFNVNPSQVGLVQP